MNKYQKAALCITLSLIAQCGVLCYADKVLLKESNEFSIATVEVPVKSLDTDVEITSDSDDIQISYSGKYITYFLDNKFILANTKTSEVNEILGDTEILNYKWVPNNNTIFIVEKESGKVKVKTYNAVNGVEQEVCEIFDYKDDMKIESFISISAEYISICSEENTTIYRIDIDKEVNKVDKTIKKLKSADVFWSKDIFIYQDSSNMNIYRYTKGESKQIPLSNASKSVILKAADNIIFLGEYSEDNRKVVKIIYGEDKTDTSTWKTQNLDKAVDIKDIYISEENEIFINDSDEKKITNITSGKSITYKGEFINVNDRVIFTLDDNKVCLKSVKDGL